MKNSQSLTKYIKPSLIIFSITKLIHIYYLTKAIGSNQLRITIKIKDHEKFLMDSIAINGNSINKLLI